MREGDREEVISTVVSAFVDDPVERWLFPRPEQYARHFPEFVAAFASEAFDRRTVWTLGELSAVAVWLPPDAQPDGDAIVAVLSRSVSPAQHGDMFSVLDQMDEGHPTFPHCPSMSVTGSRSPLSRRREHAPRSRSCSERAGNRVTRAPIPRRRARRFPR
jgi:hypothetical protein